MLRGLLTGAILSSLLLSAPAAAATFDEAVKRGALRICVVESAPYAMKTPRGRWIGHEIDIGQRLATDFGLTPAFVPVSYEDMIGRLNKGDCDLIAASLAVEPAWLREAWFTNPYGQSDVSVVAAGSAPVQQSSLDKEGVSIGVVHGAPAADFAKLKFPLATIEQFPDLISAERALDAGAVAALAHKAPIPRLIAAKAPDRYVVVDGEPLTRTASAFAIRKGDADMLNLLNGWIEARRSDGFLDRTSRYWLTTLDWRERLKPREARK